MGKKKEKKARVKRARAILILNDIFEYLEYNADDIISIGGTNTKDTREIKIVIKKKNGEKH